MPRLISLLAVAAVLALPAGAQAAFFPPEVVDGSIDVVKVGDVDLSRDGQGLVGYLKNESGVSHAFVSRLVDGVFQPPERVDAGQATATSQIAVAASDQGRMAIAFVNEGRLWTMIKPKDATGFAAPTIVTEGPAANVSIDLSINGATYVSWTHNGDVRVARANRDTPEFVTLPSPVDFDGNRDAGTGDRKASRVVVSADGTALVVWGEDGADGRTHVYARRLFELRLSTSPQDLTLDTVDGVPAGGADNPEVDIEDDSSFAQVTFRQNTANGPRVVMRRLLGSTFDPPVAADSGGSANRARIDLTGRGEGLVGASMAGNEAFGGSLWNNKFNLFNRLDSGNGTEPMTVPALGENEDGAFAWVQGTPDAAEVRGQFWNDIEKPVVEPPALLSNAPVDVKAGLDAAATRLGDVAVVFVQGREGDRKLVAALYDKPPSRAVGYNTSNPRKLTKLRWGPSLNVLGAPRYRVLLDGQPLGESLVPELTILPGQVSDGTHTWQVVSIDRRNQETVSRTRTLRVDNTPPTLRAGFRRSGRSVTVTARAGDSRGTMPTGLSRIVVDWGDGSQTRMARSVGHTYRRGGTYTIRVKARDRAGNERVRTRRIRVG